MEDQGLLAFTNICGKLCNENTGVYEGKMMSSPGLKFNNKVFAFYHKSTMGFRMGPLFDPIKYGLKFAKPLSPFKTKPPLKGWYVIDVIEKDLWHELSEMALEFTKTLK